MSEAHKRRLGLRLGGLGKGSRPVLRLRAKKKRKSRYLLIQNLTQFSNLNISTKSEQINWYDTTAMQGRNLEA